MDEVILTNTPQHFCLLPSGLSRGVSLCCGLPSTFLPSDVTWITTFWLPPALWGSTVLPLKKLCVIKIKTAKSLGNNLECQDGRKKMREMGEDEVRQPVRGLRNLVWLLWQKREKTKTDSVGWELEFKDALCLLPQMTAKWQSVNCKNLACVYLRDAFSVIKIPECYLELFLLYRLSLPEPCEDTLLPTWLKEI